MYRACLFLAVLALLGTPARSLPGTAQDKATKDVIRRLSSSQYNKHLRPHVNGSSTEVKIQTFFRDIDIDDIHMKAHFDITFRMIWDDPRLAYATSPDLAGVEYVTLLDPSPLWLPDAFFKNARVVQSKAVHPEVYLRVFPDGRLIYSTRVSLHQSCPMDLARFPHDTQTCHVKMASYGYTTDHIVFTLAEKEPVAFGKDIHADRFRFESFFTGSCDSRTATGEYSCVEVSMKIRREFRIYLLEMYIPIMFLVVVAWFSFLIPAEQFLGRVLLTLAPLITLASFANVHKDSLASVPYVIAKDIFTGVSLCVIFLTLIYVIVCHVRHNKKTEEEEKAASSPEDGGVDKPSTGQESSGWMARTARRIMNKADYLSRLLLIGLYMFFLFVYFVAYCGTG